MNRRELVFPKPGHIAEIGVIISESAAFDLTVFNNIGGNNFNVLRVLNQKNQKNKQEGCVYLNDMNFWGFPRKKIIENFINKPFDILLDVTLSENRAVDYICAKSVAKFKVGTKPGNIIHDLIISQKTPDLYSFTNELERTFKNFNSKT